jgi:hypothetical protein
MAGDAYLGNSPQYGLIHRQPFFSTGSTNTISLNYPIRHFNDILIIINRTFIPRVEYSYNGAANSIRLTTALVGDGYIIYLNTLTSGPQFSESMITEQPGLSPIMDAADIMVCTDTAGTNEAKKVTYSGFLAAINPILYGHIENPAGSNNIKIDTVTYDMMQDMPSNRILGAFSAGTITATKVFQGMFEDNAVDKTKLNNANALVISDSSGTQLFTLYGSSV